MNDTFPKPPFVTPFGVPLSPQGGQHIKPPHLRGRCRKAAEGENSLPTRGGGAAKRRRGKIASPPEGEVPQSGGGGKIASRPKGFSSQLSNSPPDCSPNRSTTRCSWSSFLIPSDVLWPARRDSNPQSSESESDALSGYATGGYRIILPLYNSQCKSKIYLIKLLPHPPNNKQKRIISP